VPSFMRTHAALLFMVSLVSADDTCSGQRCDTAACPCGCECGTATDPGLCFVPPLGHRKTADCASPDRPTVLVTGATGRTGALVYALMQTTHHVRALVRDVAKARRVLGCTNCDASEGIFVGSVSDDVVLRAATRGVSAVAIAVGVGINATQAEAEAVEFVGVQKTVAALAQRANVAALGGSATGLRVVLCSSMGTTSPPPSSAAGGSILFWKLNAEAFLGASGLSTAVVKPCGLVATPGTKTLLVGKDDALFSTSPPVVPRAEVARVMVAALAFQRPIDDGSAPLSLRFDLCAKSGSPTTDLRALLESTLYPWQQKLPR